MFAQFFKTAQKLLINSLVTIFSIGFFVGSINDVVAAPMNFGHSFNLKHKVSGKYLGCQEINDITGGVQRQLNIIAHDSKNRFTRWYFINTTAVPDPAPSTNKRYKFFEGSLPAGSFVSALRSQETSFNLKNNGQTAGKMFVGNELGMVSVLSDESFTVKVIDDTTFAFTVGADRILGYNADGTFGLAVNAAAVSAPTEQFQFVVEDIDANFAAGRIADLEVGQTLVNRGFTALGTGEIDASVQSVVNNQIIRCPVVAKNAQGQSMSFAIRGLDNRIVRFDATSKQWVSMDNITNYIINPWNWNIRLPAYADFLQATPTRLVAFARSPLVMTSQTSGLLAYQALELPWASNLNAEWYGYPAVAYKRAISDQATVSISDPSSYGDKKTMILTKDGSSTPIQTPFSVIDVSIGVDGTIWCLSSVGSVHKIKAGSLSYNDLEVAQRDLLVSSPNQPMFVTLRAVGNAAQNIVAAINSAGQLFVSVNNGPFNNFGVKGIIDCALAIDGSMILVAPAGLGNYAGYAWSGNYFAAVNDTESIKQAAAQDAAFRVGIYDDYLDVVIQIKLGDKFIRFSPDKLGLVANTTKFDSGNLFRFIKVYGSAYQITYGGKYLVVTKNNDQYMLSLKASISEQDEAVFYVYGSNKNSTVRIRHKDVYLSTNETGMVVLSPTERMMQFVSGEAIFGNEVQKNIALLASEKLRFEREMKATIDAAVAAMLALQKEAVDEAIAEKKEALKVKLTQQNDKITQLRTTLSSALAEKTKLEQQLLQIENDRVAHEAQVQAKKDELTAQMNAETDPVKKAELQRQIDMLSQTKEQLADILIQNAKTIAEQNRNISELTANNARMQQQIDTMQASSQANAEAMKAAFTGDINSMLQKLGLAIKQKLMRATGLDEQLFNQKFPSTGSFSFAALADLAAATGKTVDALTQIILPEYPGSDIQEAFVQVNADFAVMKNLSGITVATVVQKFNLDLERFAVALAKPKAEIIEALGDGFTAMATKFGISKEELDRKTIASFTEIALIFGSSWQASDQSRNLIAKIVNYDVLEKEYQDRLNADRQAIDALKAELRPAIDKNEQLRAQLRTYMDDRAVEQEKIDNSIISARREMLVAVSSDAMQVVVEKIRALQSANNEIQAQIQQKNIEIMKANATLIVQDTSIEMMNQKIEAIEASQQAFAISAAQGKKDVANQIDAELLVFKSGDAVYQQELTRIQAMNVSTSEGAISQFNALSQLQTNHFNAKGASQNKLTALTGQLVTELEKTKAYYNEQVNFLNNEKRTVTQAYNAKIADMRLSSPVATQAQIDAVTATFNEGLNKLNQKIQGYDLIIKDQESQSRTALQADMDRMKILSNGILDANSKRSESLRYQMVGQETEARRLLQDTLDRLENENTQTIRQIEVAYKAAQDELKRISAAATAENNRRKLELEQELAQTKAMYDKHRTEVETALQVTGVQKTKFEDWKKLVDAASNTLNSKVSIASANFNQEVMRLPEGFDAAINDVFKSLAQALPSYEELLGVLENNPTGLGFYGAKTSLAVREELLRDKKITDLSSMLASQMENIEGSKPCVLGFNTNNTDKPFAYVERDGNVFAARTTIGIFKYVVFSLVKRGQDKVSLELPDHAKALTVGMGSGLELTAVGATPAANQLFTIEFVGNEGGFTLKNGSQAVGFAGELGVASTLNSARLVLGQAPVTFVAFEVPNFDVDADFNKLHEEIKTRLPEIHQSSNLNDPSNPFKNRSAEFKLQLDKIFEQINAIQNGPKSYVQKLKATYDSNEVEELVTKYQAAKTLLINAAEVGLKDPVTDQKLTDKLAADTSLNADVREGIQALITEATRQAKLTADIVDEQNYRLTELRKIYLQTMVEKNLEIAYLEIDSRWQKFQWVRNLFLMVQGQLSVSDRLKLEFEAEILRASKNFEASKNALVTEKDRAIEVLKATLAEKVAAAQRAQSELVRLNKEATDLYNQSMREMQERYSKASAEEKAQINAARARRTEEYQLFKSQYESKNKAELKQLEFEQERLNAMASAQIKTLSLQIRNAKQYSLNLKIEDKSEVALSYLSAADGSIWYITRTTLDDLQVTPGIRFDQNTRFKIVKQDVESFSIETLDGARRITLLGNKKDVDLLPAQNVASSDPELANKQVAANNQKFYIEGTQTEGAVIRDFDKEGYLTIKEIAAGGKRINIIEFIKFDQAITNAANAADNSRVKETTFKLVNFTAGSGTVNELLEKYYNNTDPNLTQTAVDEADKFFNDNKLFNYPDLMDNFVQALSEYGQGRKRFMRESTLKAINKKLSDISNSFMFANENNGQIVTSGGAINLLDQDFVEPLFLEDGQFLVIELDGKFLSTKDSVSVNGVPTVAMVDGSKFNKALNFKVMTTSSRNVVTLTDLRGAKRLSVEGNSVDLVDALQAAGPGQLFTFSGTREKAVIGVGNRGITSLQQPIIGADGQPMLDANAQPKRSGQPLLSVTNNLADAVNFKVHIFKPGSLESVLISQGLDKYTNNAESKRVIDNITGKLIDLIANPEFEEDAKNYFLQTFADYLTMYVNNDSIALWAPAIKKVMFTVNKNMKKVDQSIVARMTSAIQEFNVPSGTYLVLKNIQEGTYLSVDSMGNAVSKDTKDVDLSMLLRVIKVGDKYALVGRDGTGGYLTVTDDGATMSDRTALASDGSISVQPEENQLFWLIGFGNQLMIKLGKTLIQDDSGYLVIHPNRKLTSWNFDNPEEKTRYSSVDARTKFEVQILDEHSVIRNVIRGGVAAAPGALLSGLIATRDNNNLSEQQKSLLAQRKLQEFEETVLVKEVVPAEKEGDAPKVLYNLKPAFEILRDQKTNVAQNLYSLRNTLEYIENAVFFNRVAGAGIKQGTIGDKIFRAMKEAFSEFRLLEKRFDDEGLKHIVNPGNLAVQMNAEGLPAADYIGQHLDSLWENGGDNYKGAAILHAYIMKMAKTLYSDKYDDNSNLFEINQLGQLKDKAKILYSFNSNGGYINDQNKAFDEMSNAVYDPDGKLLVDASPFNPGIGLEISRSNFSATIQVSPTGTNQDLVRLRDQIVESDNIDDVRRSAMLSVLDSLPVGPNNQINFEPFRRIINGTKESMYLVFRGKNAKRMLGAEKQMNAAAKQKISAALDLFIDGNSRILSSVVNAREVLNRIQAETVSPSLSDFKNMLERNFKFNPTFKIEDLRRIIRKVYARCDVENNQWRREMLITLYDFIGTKATFELGTDGIYNLGLTANASAAIYNQQDMLNLIEKVKRLVFTVNLRGNQKSIGDVYEELFDRWMNDYFVAGQTADGFKRLADNLKQFKDDSKPKDWEKKDTTAIDPKGLWYRNVQVHTQDGSEAAKQQNEFERTMAWDEKNKRFLIRLLTFEQQLIRMNLLEYAEAGALDQARRSRTVSVGAGIATTAAVRR